jgi:hypothetical protein
VSEDNGSNGTFFVLSGKLVLELYSVPMDKWPAKDMKGAPTVITEKDIRLDLSTVLEPGQGMTLDPLTPHRFWALNLERSKLTDTILEDGS